MKKATHAVINIIRSILLVAVVIMGLATMLGCWDLLGSGIDDSEADPPVELHVQVYGNGTVVSDLAGIDCRPDCYEEYDRFTWVGLTATPDDGWQFNGWDFHATGPGPTTQVRMEGRRIVNTVFSQQDPVYTLTVFQKGGGSIYGEDAETSEPVGIDCGSDCSEDFDNPAGSSFYDFTIVELVPDLGPDMEPGDLVFNNWSGDLDCGDGSVIMNGDKKCIGTFAPSQDHRTLNILIQGKGSVVSGEPGGIDCGNNCSQTAEPGETIVLDLTAIPDYGSSFNGWGGVCEGTHPTTQVTIDGGMYYYENCIAYFKDADAPPIASFTITKSEFAADPSVSVDASASQDDQAIVSYDWDFDYDGNVFNPTASGMTANHTYPAVGTYIVRLRVTDNQGLEGFAEQTVEITDAVIPGPGMLYALDISTAGNGSVATTLNGADCRDECPNEIENGVLVSLTPVPDSGWVFTGWSGGFPGEDRELEFVMDASVAVTANFSPIEDPCENVDCGPNSHCEIQGADAVCVCDEGYVADGPDCVIEEIEEEDDPCDPNPCPNTTCQNVNGTAVCEELPEYILNVLKDGDGSVFVSPPDVYCDPSCSRLYSANTSVMLSAYDTTGWEFDHWTGNCSGTNPDITVEMNSDTNCTAVFIGIGIPPTASFSYSPTQVYAPTPAYAGTQVTFTGTGSDADGTVTGYAWDLGDGNFIPGSETATITYDTPGQYTVRLQVTDNDGLTGLATRTVQVLSTTPTRTLTVSTSGSGAVTSSPSGINCGGDCTEDYSENTSVTLTAQADTGWQFDTWGGACSGTDPVSPAIVMDTEKTCSAAFIAVSGPTASFTVSPNPAQVNNSVTFDASASSTGVDLYEWDFDGNGSIDASGDETSHRITQFVYGTADTYIVMLRVTDNDTSASHETTRTLEVRAGGSGPTLTVVNQGFGDGTVVSDPVGINCAFSGATATPAPCSATFQQNQTVLLTPAATGGSFFSHWVGCDDLMGVMNEQCIVNINGTRTVTVYFE